MIATNGEKQGLYSLEVEKKLLGAMFSGEDVREDILTQVKAGDFYSPKHALIYESFEQMAASGRAVIEMVDLVEHMRHTGALEKIGNDITVITDIFGRWNSKSGYEDYINSVLDYSKRRQVLEVAEKVKASARDITKDLALNELAERLINISLGAGGSVPRPIEKMTAYIKDLLARRTAKENGFMTRFKELNRKTTGLKAGQLAILAARPGMGKSALAQVFAMDAIEQGKVVAYFNLEMSDFQTYDRMIASAGGVQFQKLQAPKALSEEDINKAIQCAEKLGGGCLHTFDKDCSSPNDILKKCLAVKTRCGLDLIIIDYLQLMQMGDRYRDNRVQEVSYISRQLKLIAMRLEVPVIALSQLSRTLEGRDNKRPKLSDLRESGSIEQDADIVFMLYRDSYYDEKSTDRTTELIIRKNRNGELGTVYLEFYGETMRFYPSNRPQCSA